MNEIEGEVLFKIRQDLQIVRASRFLHRYSIDKILQLFDKFRCVSISWRDNFALPEHRSTIQTTLVLGHKQDYFV